MTVAELMAHLAQFPPDFQVVVASDAEGNSYYPLDERMGTYYAEGEYEKEIWTEEAWKWKCEEDGEERPFPGDNCLVVGP